LAAWLTSSRAGRVAIVALIWRSIFEVDDERFADEAAAHMQGWLRWKLKNDSVIVPRDGTVEHLEDVWGAPRRVGGLSALKSSTHAEDRPQQVSGPARHSVPPLRSPPARHIRRGVAHRSKAPRSGAVETASSAKI